MTPAIPSRDESIRKILSLDPLIHAPVRFAILLFLFPRGQTKFAELQKALGLTPGNLSSHLKKLVKHQYIHVEKGFQNAKPTTIVYLTQEGRKATLHYMNDLTESIQTLRETLR